MGGRAGHNVTVAATQKEACGLASHTHARAMCYNSSAPPYNACQSRAVKRWRRIRTRTDACPCEYAITAATATCKSPRKTAFCLRNGLRSPTGNVTAPSTQLGANLSQGGLKGFVVEVGTHALRWRTQRQQRAGGALRTHLCTAETGRKIRNYVFVSTYSTYTVYSPKFWEVCPEFAAVPLVLRKQQLLRTPVILASSSCFFVFYL